MLSAHTQQGAQETLDALAAGAVDFITKPDGEVSTDLSGVKEELFRKIRAASLSKPRGEEAKRTSVRPVAPKPSTARRARPTSGREKVVLLAISTGGPAALEKVVPRLPADFPAPVIIVQHMPKAFTKALAKRLDGISAVDVKEAEAGDELSPGRVLIAPGDHHLVFDSTGRVRLSVSAPVHGCRPSADVTLQAASRLLGARLHIVVMTGMGKDGALGSQAAKASGARVFAQDQATSVVWGMPKAVVDLGIAEGVLALEDIAPKLVELVG
jgi:two-component system chemotaxis response regulator CheB